jgi:AraC family transcriptional regulator of adaptative response / DNA-3-methyladenine glycosylase II
LLLAKRLITETQLPLTEIAFAAGFDSVRRFNALFRSHYRLTPTSLRRSAARPGLADCFRLTLAYRPPLDWQAVLRFLSARAIPGVECVTSDTYQRTVGVGAYHGWLCVAPIAGRNVLAVDLATALVPVLPAILARLRNLFDLDARPDLIAGQLALEPLLAPWVERHPGLRVPGAFDPFELGIRAILGQQVSVRGASTLAGRLVQQFGEAIETPLSCLNRLAPAPETVARARSSAFAGIGLPAARAESLRSLARAIERHDVDLEPGVNPTAKVARLMELPGIGPWTAQYIAMRAMRWPDAFPATDLGLVKASGLKSAEVLARTAERWRPWRAYAAMHLWERLKAPTDQSLPHEE